MKDKKVQSYITLITTMLIFGTVGIFRKNIALSSGLLACSRGLLGAMFILLFVKLRGKSLRHNIGRKKVILLAFIGALIGANWILLFESYNYTSVATATLCYYMQPTFVVIASAFVLKEKLTVKRIICVLLSVAGMIFVSGILDGNSAEVTDLRGILFGLGAAALYAAVVVIGKLIIVEDPFEKTFIQLLSASVVLIPYLLLTEDFSAVTLSGLSIVMLLILGIFHTGIAYTMYFGSMQELPAQSIAVLSYIDPVSALILSALLLHEPMSIYSIIGAVLIIGAAFIGEINTCKKNS